MTATPPIPLEESSLPLMSTIGADAVLLLRSRLAELFALAVRVGLAGDGCGSGDATTGSFSLIW